ncbi:MAG TPA: class I adenylate-forming enzyme family protein [Bacillales bacterium]
MTLADWIFTDRIGERDKTVLATFSGQYSLSDIENGMERYISLLRDVRDVKRRKVAILVPQIASYLQLFLAVNHLEGVVVPLSWQLRKDDLSALLDFLDPDVIFTINEYQGFSFSELITKWAAQTGKRTTVLVSEDGSEWSTPYSYPGEERPRVEEPADVIACSSGSTGLPKGIMVDNGYLIRNGAALASMLQVNERDRLFENIHPSVLHGLAWLMAGLKTGYLTLAPETFDVPRLVQLFREMKPTKVSTTPSLFRNLYTFAKGMKALDGFNSLEVTVLGGEMVSEELIDTVSGDLGCRLVSFYGASEAGLLMNTASDLRESIDWEVCEGIDHRIVDGEIMFKIPKNFLGYYKRPDLTKEIIDEEGWYSSGDLAELNERKKIVIKGRKKDLIKKGGQSIIPGEIERVIADHPNVKQAVVVGVPHPVMGEKLVGFIVRDSEVSGPKLKKFCANRIAAYKVPDEYLFLDEIPTNNGKADRMVLRKMAVSPEGSKL